MAFGWALQCLLMGTKWGDQTNLSMSLFSSRKKTEDTSTVLFLSCSAHCTGISVLCCTAHAPLGPTLLTFSSAVSFLVLPLNVLFNSCCDCNIPGICACSTGPITFPCLLWFSPTFVSSQFVWTSVLWYRHVSVPGGTDRWDEDMVDEQGDRVNLSMTRRKRCLKVGMNRKWNWKLHRRGFVLPDWGNQCRDQESVQRADTFMLWCFASPLHLVLHVSLSVSISWHCSHRLLVKYPLTHARKNPVLSPCPLACERVLSRIPTPTACCSQWQRCKQLDRAPFIRAGCSSLARMGEGREDFFGGGGGNVYQVLQFCKPLVAPETSVMNNCSEPVDVRMTHWPEQNKQSNCR